MSAVGSSVISESLIFVSYHNRDIAYAFQLANLLIRCYRNAWLDRFEIELAADWQDEIRAARARATAAVAIVSDDYLQSKHCRAEFQRFQERGIPVVAVIARDFSTDEISNFSFNDWVDFRRWFDDPNDVSVENLLGLFPESESVGQTGERLDYLRQFMQATEAACSRMPTSWAAIRNGEAPGAGDIRPRMLQTGLLREWEFTATKANHSAPQQDLLAWAQSEPQFAIVGEAGSGKTFFTRLLALEAAHSALRDEKAPAPVWLDLARWDTSARSLDDYMEANWPLLTYWRHWISTKPTLLIFDNWSDFCGRAPSQAAELMDWIESNPELRCVLLMRPGSPAGKRLPEIHLGRMKAQLAQRMASGVLTLEQQNSFRHILRHKEALIEDGSLAYLAMGLELLSADRALANNQWQRDPAPALLRLRGQDKSASRFGLRFGDALAGLEELAWSMMQQDRHRFVTEATAREIVGDVRIIEYALEIGFLSATGPWLRFESELLQQRLAAESLKRDGLTKYLSRPTFAADTGRLPRKWDKLMLLVVDSLGAENRLRAIDQIAEIDPFLAGMCLRRHPELHSAFRDTFIAKLIDLCAANAAARGAFRSALADLPEQGEIADALMGQMGRLNNKLQLWLWREIAALPLDLPVDFIERVGLVDGSGAKSAVDLFAPYPLSRSVAYLVALSQQDDAGLRRNAIWLLGELKYLPSAILLLDFLDTAKRDDLDTVLRSLMKFAYSEILLRVLRWSEDHPEHRAAVLSALSARKRRVTSRLLMLSDAKRLALRPDFHEMVVDTAEHELAIGLAQLASEHIELPETVETAVAAAVNASSLKQRVASGIKDLPNRDGFGQLLAAIVAVLRDPPEATVIAGSNIDALLFGEPVFDELKAQGTAPDVGSVPAEIAGMLRHNDWRQRHQAVNQLVSYPAEASLPLLLEATADTDKRVRLAAFESLSRFDGEISAQKAVVAALSDPDIEIVKAATEHLCGVVLIDYDSLVDLLDSANEATVAAAIEVLDAAGNRAAIVALERLVGDARLSPQDGVSIGQLARRSIASLEAATIDGDDSRHAATGLGEDKPGDFSDEEKIRRTLQVLRDDDWGRTQKAAKFLRKFARHLRGRGKSDITHMLCDALGDDNWSVRWAAVEALAVLGDGAAIPSIKDCLQDPHWIVQVAAVRALVELGAADSAAALLPLLQSRQTQVRETAAEALGEFKDARTAPHLGAALKDDPDDFVRLAALKSLCAIDAEGMRSWLEMALSDRYLSVRLYSMRQLGPAMDESDLPILRKLLEDDEAPAYETATLRELAVDALRRIDSAASRSLLDSAVYAAEERTQA